MENKDLVWDLEHVRKYEQAKEFILGVENQLCVFSSAVEQLYTNYDVFFPKDENRKIVILPNPYSPHDTFHGIPEESVKATGLFLVNGPTGEDGTIGKLQLVIPINKEKKQYRRVPLAVGLRMINAKRAENRQFLPVVMKGDLREFNQRVPCIHLHSLSIDQVPMLSELELNAIQRVILDRLTALARS